MATRTINQRVNRVYFECAGVWGQSRVSDLERRCIEDWRGRMALSGRELAILAQIEAKVFPGEDEA